MSTRKTSVKNPSTPAATAEVPVVAVHDLKGVVVFPMSQERQKILCPEGFKYVCEDLQSGDYTLICRHGEQMVYVHLSPIVVPMDMVLSPTPPTPEALAAARRKAIRKTVANKR